MMEIMPTVFAAVMALAFLCEYVDSSLGMGYGTTLTPLLLLLGFSPLQIVPAVLLSEFLTGIIAGLFHHSFGNIHLDFRRDRGDGVALIRKKLSGLGYIPRSHDAKVVLLLAGCGIVGTLVAVSLALSIPKIALKTYIGAMVLAIGMLILLQGVRRGQVAFSWRRLALIGLISSFNKGISGGGYGPLLTGGQILAGRDSKSAVGSTSFAEGLVCLVGFLAYLGAQGSGGIYWGLAVPLVIGAVMSTPLAALTTKKIPAERLKMIIGIVTILLGSWTLIEVFRG